MDKLKQRIAIAEECGFVWYRLPIRNLRSLFHPALHEYEGQDPRWMVRADGTEPIANERYMTTEGNVPDYLNDLNAMHEAEKLIVCDIEKCFTYQRALAKAADVEQYPIANAFIWHASAHERAEAFLRTIGKWEE